MDCRRSKQGRSEPRTSRANGPIKTIAAGRRWKLLITAGLAAILLLASCSSDDDEVAETPAETTDVTDQEDQTGTGDGCGDDCTFTPPEGLANCVGQYTGTYSGQAEGVVTVLLGPDGSLVSSAFPDVVVALGPDGFVDLVAEDGTVLDADASSANGRSAVGDDGNIRIEVEGGPAMEGSFDWATCTGAGEWSSAELSGEWNLAQDPTAIRVAPDACVDGRFVGTAADVQVGPGADGTLEVVIGPDGATIGGIEIDLDAICLSQTVVDGEAVDFDEVTDDIEVRQGDGFVSYLVEGDLLFPFNSAGLDSGAETTIETVAASVVERFPDGEIRILGHTDSVGPEAYNLDLSRARAETVAAELRADERLAERMITTAGLGESTPVAPNANADGTDNPDGRARNRRVEIVVLVG